MNGINISYREALRNRLYQQATRGIGNHGSVSIDGEMLVYRHDITTDKIVFSDEPAFNSPFTVNGVQCVVVHCPGWASPAYMVEHTAAVIKARMNEYIEEMLPFTDNIEVSYYGYDPTVRADDMTVIGTDGYPDYIGKYNPDTEEVDWEEA